MANSCLSCKILAIPFYMIGGAFFTYQSKNFKHKIPPIWGKPLIWFTPTFFYLAAAVNLYQGLGILQYLQEKKKISNIILLQDWAETLDEADEMASYLMEQATEEDEEMLKKLISEYRQKSDNLTQLYPEKL